MATAPLVKIDEAEARSYGETVLQLRESERYEYELISVNGADLRLRCALSTRRKSIGKMGRPDGGLIETRSFCGTLQIEVVSGEADYSKPPLATTLVDVRSIKLDYRTDYRGMLRRLSEEMVGLIADSRSSAKVTFRSTFQERTDEGWLQVQIELLRETLDSPDFSAALQRILTYPHERLGTVYDSITTDRAIRWTPSAVRQLLTNNPRRHLPIGHNLQVSHSLHSIAERVQVPRKYRTVDTPENRFVKFALKDFLAFLTHAQTVFEATSGWSVSATLAARLGAHIDNWLGHSLFQEVGELQFAPLGSPVLQRKSGYRELLRWWLRFRTGSELSWEGGEDLFRSGQRDVATLYEYWLFFELLHWFCKKCRGGDRPSIEEIVEGLEDGSPNLRLKKGKELGPFVGLFAGSTRRLNAQFSYNRRFEATNDRNDIGSWTRALHPDYTLSFWPEGLSEAEAERRESLVHVHFDAKYRIENIEALFGAEDEDDVDEEVEGNYKRQDLLKMHAYRDAIKRSQGAYVLYPGRSGWNKNFKGFFHEILPGLGAFGIAPDQNGSAEGLRPLEEFLDAVLSHLCNRTTAQERLSYHAAESYSLEEPPVPYEELALPEFDFYGTEFRALPPAEEMVLLALYEGELQYRLAQSDRGLVYTLLRNEQGALQIHHNLAMVRYIVMYSPGPVFAQGLLVLREPGFEVFTRDQLRVELKKAAHSDGEAAWKCAAGNDNAECLYALFRTERSERYAMQAWDAEEMLRQLSSFERDVRSKPIIKNVAISFDWPRIVPLRSLLKVCMRNA